MVDATISTALDINDVANPSKLKLLKRLCPQRPGRLPALSGVINGSKRVDIPVHKEAAVGLGALDKLGSAMRSTSPYRKSCARSLEALYCSVASKSVAPSKDTRMEDLFFLGSSAPSASEALLIARRPGVLQAALFCPRPGSMRSPSNIADR